MNRNDEKIGRRDFICASALFCGMINLPLVKRGFAKQNEPKGGEEGINPVDLAAYCGLYCGACDIYQKRIGKAGNELKNVLNAYSFGEFAGDIPGLEEYASFDKVLTNLINFFGQCVGCQKGGGNPACQIRTCCTEKGFKTCAECSSFPCDKVEIIVDSYPSAKENIEQIKKIGLEKWAQKQQEMVDKGFRYSEAMVKTQEG